ncbi:AMP-binding protein [Streptomyces sp. NPDC047017]|uniref:AMP-binding protein n=1 Tax=Streptomyces sp. NPDC047017 TaxID=3155024 RepID=UPI0033F71CE1
MSAATLLSWLESPSTRTGVNFGTREGGWHRQSYAELARLSRRAAHALVRAGVGTDDVVALVLPSSPAFVAAFFGTLLAGATPAPLAPPLAGAPSAAGYDDRMSALLAAARPRAVIADRTPARPLPPGIPLLHSAALLGHPEETGPGRTPAARGLVQFTSGSGGRARGVALGAAALAGHVAAIRDWLEAGPGTVWASWLPVHHDMGLVGCLLGPVLAQDELWLMRPETFVRRPLEYLRCFGLRGASVSATPAFGLDHILRKVRPEDLTGLDFSGWHSLVVGAERIPPGTLRGFHALLGLHGLRRATLLPAYGLAEASLAVTGVRHGQQWTEEKSVVGCGSPLPGTTVRIVGDDGRDLPDRTVGEIAVRGPQIALGHLGDDLRDTRIGDGELRTGDAGFLADGQLFVHGRIGDGLKLRGQWVFAEDVEQTLRRAGLLPPRSAVVLGEDATGPVAALVTEDDTTAGGGATGGGAIATGGAIGGAATVTGGATGGGAVATGRTAEDDTTVTGGTAEDDTTVTGRITGGGAIAAGRITEDDTIVTGRTAEDDTTVTGRITGGGAIAAGRTAEHGTGLTGRTPGDGGSPPGASADDAVRRLLRRAVPGADALVLRVGRGTLARTPSGKPRRRVIWHSLVEHAADHPQP